MMQMTSQKHLTTHEDQKSIEIEYVQYAVRIQGRYFHFSLFFEYSFFLSIFLALPHNYPTHSLSRVLINIQGTVLYQISLLTKIVYLCSLICAVCIFRTSYRFCVNVEQIFSRRRMNIFFNLAPDDAKVRILIFSLLN